MKTAKDYRHAAWEALKDKAYWPFLGGLVVLSLIIVSVVFLFAFLGTAFTAYPLLSASQSGAEPTPEEMVRYLSAAAPVILIASVGVLYLIGFSRWAYARMSLAVMRHEMKFELFGSGWRHGWKMCWILCAKWFYLQLWFLLLIVPGIVKTFSYALTEYIAVDHPDWTANQCITESRRLMAGHRWRFFCLGLSFIGWWLLAMVAGVLIPYIGNFVMTFLSPYFMSAFAAFYEDRKAMS